MNGYYSGFVFQQQLVSSEKINCGKKMLWRMIESIESDMYISKINLNICVISKHLTKIKFPFCDEWMPDLNYHLFYRLFLFPVCSTCEFTVDWSGDDMFIKLPSLLTSYVSTIFQLPFPGNFNPISTLDFDKNFT